jgi:hypothetical protein
MKLLILIILCSIFCIGNLTAGQHQVGQASSGRAKAGTHRLESVLGQSVNGFSGEATSGFLSVTLVPDYKPGDVDGSGDVNISDGVFLISYIFSGGMAPVPLERGDVNCSGGVNISDAVFLISYIFSGGKAPQYCR